MELILPFFVAASITSPQNGLEPPLQPSYYASYGGASCEPGAGGAGGAGPLLPHLTNGEPQPPPSLSPRTHKRKRLPEDDVENGANTEDGSTATATTGQHHGGDGGSYYGKSPSSQPSHTLIGVGHPSWGGQQPITADHPPPPPPPHPSLDPTRWRHPPFIGAESHHTMPPPPHLMWEGGWQPPY